ncbi:MAG: hypothetical protein U0641_02640 [Anaerolineae bacterium]
MPSKRPSLTDIAEEVARIAPAESDDATAPTAAAEGAPKPKTRKRTTATVTRVTDNSLREALAEKDRVIEAQAQAVTALRELADALRGQVDRLTQERDELRQQIADAASPPKKRRRRIPIWKPF